jgi:hypothetical protein
MVCFDGIHGTHVQNIPEVLAALFVNAALAMKTGATVLFCRA